MDPDGGYHPPNEPVRGRRFPSRRCVGRPDEWGKVLCESKRKLTLGPMKSCEHAMKLSERLPGIKSASRRAITTVRISISCFSIGRRAVNPEGSSLRKVSPSTKRLDENWNAGDWWWVEAQTQHLPDDHRSLRLYDDLLKTLLLRRDGAERIFRGGRGTARWCSREIVVHSSADFQFYDDLSRTIIPCVTLSSSLASSSSRLFPQRRFAR
jgi:hypothetical protein